MIIKFNKFHIVTQRPWPILSSIQIWSIIILMVYINQFKIKKKILLSFITVLTITAIMWWNNTIKETLIEGAHQNITIKGIKKAILLFILSEIIFFLSFFWSYFHERISPNVEIGQIWPPYEIKTFNPINVPILNTIILIRSGFSITWSHHLIIENKLKKSKITLILTLVLGVYFSMLQIIEYKQSEFSNHDSSYGTIFFIATGFHGLHVIIGSTFIIINVLKINKFTLNQKNHIIFELSAWYWHFVDVVWLFLYLSVYWWGK